MNNGSVADMSEMSVEGFITGGQISVCTCVCVRLCVRLCLVGLSSSPCHSSAKSLG